MNLVKEYLASIEGVHIYAILSMLIFLVTFVFMIYQTYMIGKERIKEYGNIPMEEDECTQK